MPQVTSDQVADYRDLVDALALRMSRTKRAQQVGADQDDLAQEGLIDVWKQLRRGVHPSAENIRLRMLDHLRWLGRQQGVGPRGAPQHVPYSLELEDDLPQDPSNGALDRAP